MNQQKKSSKSFPLITKARLKYYLHVVLLLQGLGIISSLLQTEAINSIGELAYVQLLVFIYTVWFISVKYVLYNIPYALRIRMTGRAFPEYRIVKGYGIDLIAPFSEELTSYDVAYDQQTVGLFLVRCVLFCLLIFGIAFVTIATLSLIALGL